MVSDEYVPHVAPLYAYRNLARFKADLDLLARGRKALTLEEFLTVTRDGNPPPKNSLLLTFDDGFREMHDLAAPILTAKGIPATFFVISETLDNQALCFQQKIALLIQRTQTIATPAQCTATQAKLSQAGIKSDNIGAALKSVPWAKRAILDELAPLFELNFSSYARQHQPYLSSTQISTLLNRGFSIGAHSISHPRYADLTHEEQRGQTRESMEALATRFSLKHRAFAFPHTDHGVGRAFFDTVRREAIVEATFGTSGPALDCVANSFQRFSMEKPDLPGKPLLARHAIRGLRSKRVNRS
jgi:peptidoglycan/xylan/chitin deacetylase (PgdA/CDA1 family)